MDGFEVKAQLWDQIVERIPPAEVEEIHRIIGERLIDASRTLFQEVEALLDIWKILRESQPEKKPSQGMSRFAAARGLPMASERDILLRKIGTYSHHLRKKGENKIVSSEREALMLSMAVNDLEPMQAVLPSRKKKEDTSPSLSHAVRIDGIDAIVDNVRSALLKEQADYEADAEFLRECIEREHSTQVTAPDIGELRAFSQRLEKDLASLEEKQKPPPLSLGKVVSDKVPKGVVSSKDPISKVASITKTRRRIPTEQIRRRIRPQSARESHRKEEPREKEVFVRALPVVPLQRRRPITEHGKRKKRIQLPAL